MATVAQLLAAVASKVESDLGPTRLPDDYRDDLSQVSAGGFRYQLRGSPVGSEFLSNRRFVRAQVQVELIRKLGTAEAERAWTEGALLTHMGKLTDPEWWRALSEVHSVVAFDSELPSRNGRIITDTVTATVDVKP